VVLYASEESPTSINGTWAEGDATTLKISIPKLELEAALPDATNALQSDGKGNWTFAIPKKLEPGSYDIVVETTDANKRKSFDQTKFEINVKAPPAPPPLPTVVEQKAPSIAVFAGETSPTVITGTWDETNAKSLKVSVPGAGITATQGTDAALTSSNGAWSLALPKPLLPGIYNVVVETTDAAGKIATDATTAEIYIKAPPPPPPAPEPVAPAPAPVAAAPAPAPAAPAFDCDGAFAKIATEAPIRFEFGRTRLIAPYDVAVNQYADLLKNPDCASLKVEIAGHADYFGPQAFNQALSELRAQRIVRALNEAGIDTARLSTAGLSELQPLDPEKNKDARSKNRRVELKLVK
jgi:outer membrane protein OmpA-like peptidoglycan-associated protein